MNGFRRRRIYGRQNRIRDAVHNFQEGFIAKHQDTHGKCDRHIDEGKGIIGETVDDAAVIAVKRSPYGKGENPRHKVRQITHRDCKDRSESKEKDSFLSFNAALREDRSEPDHRISYRIIKQKLSGVQDIG